MSLSQANIVDLALPPKDDLVLGRVHMSLRQYAAMEAVYCTCDALCTCNWDDPGEKK